MFVSIMAFLCFTLEKFYTLSAQSQGDLDIVFLNMSLSGVENSLITGFDKIKSTFRDYQIFSFIVQETHIKVAN
jgi:hypothetical protein